MTFRRNRIVAWLIGILLIPLVVHGQAGEKTYRIGLLGSLSNSYLFENPDIFRYALQGYGYERGKNLYFAVTNARQRGDAGLSDLAAELLGLNLDVIIAIDLQAAVALRQVTQTIPIVMLAESDPVDTGLVANLARPGGNVTGVSILVGKLVSKRLELIKEIMPSVGKVCVLRNRDNANQRLWHAAQDAAQRIGLILQLQESSDRYEELSAIAPQAVDAQCRAIFLLDGGTFWTSESLIIRQASEHQLPVICDEPSWASHALGCLFGYGPQRSQIVNRLVYQVDRILKGTPPGEIPVEQPTQFTLAVNLWVAETLGIEIPPLMLMQADKIFR